MNEPVKKEKDRKSTRLNSSHDQNSFPTRRSSDLLLDNGYPQYEIDNCGDHFYCRHWEEVINE